VSRRTPQPVVGPGRPLRGDRIHRYVNAFCPTCHEEDPQRALADVRRLSGWLAERDGRIWLERGCPVHGFIRTLYDESPEILSYLETWTAPTKSHVADSPGNYLPVPSAYLHGLPEMQTQHTCILLEDVTERCNLACPTCFADSAPALTGVAPVQDVLTNVDARLAREDGRLDVVMLSGGEPTLHPQFARLLDELVARPIVRILVNTNGLTIAKDDALLALFARHHQRVEVYLQYDGHSERSSRHHRGGDLRAFKDAAIERLSGAGVFVTLTMTAALGVNDDEIGHVILRSLETPFVCGVSIQPQFGSGRSGAIDPTDRLTHTGVLARMGPQTDGLVTWRDLTALPCSHPHCASVGYMLKDDSGTWRSLTEVIGHDRLLEWLDLVPEDVANRITDQDLPAQMRTVVKESLLGLMSDSTSLSHPQVGDLWKGVCDSCDIGMSTLATLAGSRLPGGQDRLRRLLADRVKRISVKPFMDMSTMIEERLTQCCVHVGTRADGTGGSDPGADQCAPFCAVQAWGPLAAQKIGVGSRSAPAPVPVDLAIGATR